MLIRDVKAPIPDRRKRPKHSEDAAASASSPLSLPAPGATRTKRRSKNRNQRRSVIKHAQKDRKAESYTSFKGVNILDDCNISENGWQGKNPRATKSGRELVAEWENFTILRRLVSFTRIPYCK